MIQLERMNGGVILVNPDHIRFIEECPDCLVTFYDGKTMLVKTSAAEVQKKIIQYKTTVGTAWTQQHSLVSP